MNVTYACHRCQRTTRAEWDWSTDVLRCVHCRHETTIPPTVTNENRIRRCVICPSTEMYVRKDFPQRLGVIIVVIGFASSCIPWYFHQWLATFAILFSTALIDVVLYFVMGNLLQCYQCHAQYRGILGSDGHEPFNLEVHERHRQQAARLVGGPPTVQSPRASEEPVNP